MSRYLTIAEIINHAVAAAVQRGVHLGNVLRIEGVHLSPTALARARASAQALVAEAALATGPHGPTSLAETPAEAEPAEGA